MHQMTVPIVDNTVDVVFSKAIVPASYLLGTCIYVFMYIYINLCIYVRFCASMLLCFFTSFGTPIQFNRPTSLIFRGVPGPTFWTGFALSLRE